MTRPAAPPPGTPFKQHNSVTKGSDSGIQQKLTDASRLMSTIIRAGGKCLPRRCHAVKRLPARLNKGI